MLVSKDGLPAALRAVRYLGRRRKWVPTRNKMGGSPARP